VLLSAANIAHQCVHTLGLPRLLPLALKPPREVRCPLLGERCRSCWSRSGALLLPYLKASYRQSQHIVLLCSDCNISITHHHCPGHSCGPSATTIA
jgi:hypothetical protein